MTKTSLLQVYATLPMHLSPLCHATNANLYRFVQGKSQTTDAPIAPATEQTKNKFVGGLRHATNAPMTKKQVGCRFAPRYQCTYHPFHHSLVGSQAGRVKVTRKIRPVRHQHAVGKGRGNAQLRRHSAAMLKGAQRRLGSGGRGGRVRRAMFGP